MNPATATTSRLEELLNKARHKLKMGVAYYGEVTRNSIVVREPVGEPSKFGLPAGTEVPLDETYCRHMLAGTQPQVVPDTKDNLIMMELGVEEVIGCYMGVPLKLSDGRVLGSLCCLGTEPDPELKAEKARILKELAREVAEELEKQEVALAEPLVTNDRIELSLWFSNMAKAPSAARRAILVLEKYLNAEQFANLKLLVSELVTNSVRHSGVDGEGTIGLSISLARDDLYLSVSDSGAGFEVPDELMPHQDKPGGFGLIILDQLTAEWGISKEELFRIWFRMDLNEEMSPDYLNPLG